MNKHRCVLVLWGLLLVVVAAIPFWYLDHQRSLKSVTGIVLDRQAASMVYADQITLRDGQGRVWTFQVDAEVVTNNEEPQSASHLRQHMAVADPVTVQYRTVGGKQVAYRIRDAASP